MVSRVRIPDSPQINNCPPKAGIFVFERCQIYLSKSEKTKMISERSEWTIIDLNSPPMGSLKVIPDSPPSPTGALA
jgi:hypothetical protein